MSDEIIRIRCPCCDSIIEFNVDTGEVVHRDMPETSEKRIPAYLEFGVKGDPNGK